MGRVAWCCPQGDIFWRLLSTVVLDNGAVSHLGGLPPTLGLVRVKCGPPWSNQGPKVPAFLLTWRRWAGDVRGGDTATQMLRQEQQ